MSDSCWDNVMLLMFAETSSETYSLILRYSSIDITPESTRITAMVPSENTAFFLMEGFVCSLRLNKLNAIKISFTTCKLTQKVSFLLVKRRR